MTLYHRIFLIPTIVTHLILNFTNLASYQKTNPVSFKYEVIQGNENQYHFHLTAVIEEGWHIYSIQQPKAAIAIPTSLTFQKNPLIIWKGTLKEIGKAKKQTLAVLNIDQNIFTGKVEYDQEFVINAKIKTNLIVTVTYEACTETKCLPPITFQINALINTSDL